MPISVDELQIELNAKATNANDAIDKLVLKLDKLSTSLGKINGSAIAGLANSVEKLGRSMQLMNTIRTSDFTSLANNIEKLSRINTNSLNMSASALSNMTRSFNQLGSLSQNAQQVGALANSLAKLGNKTVVRATQNIPQLANSLNYLMQVLSKAPVVNANVISLINSLSSLTAQGSKVGSASNSIVRGLNNISTASDRATKRTFSLASAFGKFYASYFLVIRGLQSLWGSIKTTADYIESFNYYTVAFDKIASEWDEKYESYGSENAKKYTNAFVEQMGESFEKLSGVKLNLSEDLESGILSDTGMKNLGLNIQEVTQYASQLASITNSVGQTGEVSLMTADAFTKLAGDMSSLFNVDYSTVAKNLQSGLIGQSRALYKYGIDITNATLQTYAYENGINKAVSEMTQMEKMQLRMIAILDQSKVSWGDLADTINTPANMIRQLSNNFKEASMVLGQLFMPLLTKLLPFINGVVIALKNLFTTIAGFLGISIDLNSVGTGATDVTEDIYDMTDGLDQATESARKLKKQLQGFDKLNVITTQTSAGSGVAGAVGGSIDLSDEIQKATEEYQKAWDEAYAKMENKAQAFAENVAKALQPIKDLFYHLSIGDFFAAGQDVSKLVISINEFLSKAINNVDWQKVGENIGNFLAGIDWVEILDSFGELFWDALEASIELWGAMFEAAPIETAILTGIGTLKFTGLGKLLAKKLSTAAADDIALVFSNVALALSTFQFGTPFDLIGVQILEAIEKGIEIVLPKWAEELLGNIVAGISVGAVAGSWLPGIGTFVGAIIGGIIGALNGIQVDGQSVLNTLLNKLFNYDLANAWLEEAIKSFKTAFDGNRIDWLDMGAYIFEGVVEGMLAALTYITEPFIDLFWWVWDGICNVFGIASPAKEMEPLGAFILEGVLVGIKSGFASITTTFQEMFDTYITPWFTAEKWMSLSNGIKTGLQSKWEEVKNWWNNKPSLAAISVAINNLLQPLKDAWNDVVDWWDGVSLDALKIDIKVPKITVTFDEDDKYAWIWKKLGADGTPKFGVTFKQYENGGFPEDGWFRASKGEYFGSFDDGTSVIANNNQIISGIANGVKSANAEQNSLLREQNALLRQILAKDTGISTRDIFDAVRSENRDYINRNGESAFAY